MVESKAEDAGGLMPTKDGSAVIRRTLLIFKLFDYKWTYRRKNFPRQLSFGIYLCYSMTIQGRFCRALVRRYLLLQKSRRRAHR